MRTGRGRRIHGALLAVVLVAGACSASDDGTATTSTTVHDDPFGPDGCPVVTAVATSATADDPETTGPHELGYRELTLVDAARDDRPLRTSIWYPREPGSVGDPAVYEVLPGFAINREGLATDAPVAEGPWPVVVFSHGNLGTRIQSLGLTETLASHGFVVVAPDHTGNTFLDAGDVEAALESAFIRPHDISFVIDEVEAMGTEPGGPFENRLDPRRIGVSGHSYGGFTSLAVAAGTPTSDADDRVCAIAPLAPASSLVQTDYLATIEIPTLIMGAELDGTTPIDFEITRPFETIPAQHLYRVDLLRGDHNSFTMICSAGEYLNDPNMPEGIRELAIRETESACAPDVVDGPTAQAIIAHYVVSFFEVHLVGDAAYQAYLSPRDAVDWYEG